MTKTELIKAIAQRTGSTHKDAAAAVEAVLDILTDQATAADKVVLPGFGTFGGKQVEERVRRHPQKTDQNLTIPAHVKPYFKASFKLKDKINGRTPTA